MNRFQTVLVSGTRNPYVTWVFVVVPPELEAGWGPGRKDVRGKINGHPFTGTASRGEGVLRIPIPKSLREKAGIKRGDRVEVELAFDTDRPLLPIPIELQSVFNDDPEVAAFYDRLPPAHRRAWATYVAEAKRPETRLERARRAPDGIRARVFPR